MRPGEENLPAIVGAGVAAQIAKRELGVRVEYVAHLQTRLWDKLKQAIPLIRLNGPEPGPQRLVTNLNISAEFTEGEGLMLMADTRGIAIGSGTACVLKSLKSSPVLDAIGVPRELAMAAVTLSPGKDNTESEIDRVAEVFPKLVEKLRSMSPTWDQYRAGNQPSKITGRQVNK